LNPTESPTFKPSFGPTVPGETRSPTKLPTFQPTASPAPACAQVCCSFSLRNELNAIYLNGVDVTNLITNRNNNNARDRWSLTFTETPGDMILAVEGGALSGNNQRLGLFNMECTVPTRPASPWEGFDTRTGTWNALLDTCAANPLDTFPSNWYTAAYTGPYDTAANNNGNNGLGNSDGCGVGNNNGQSIRAQDGGTVPQQGDCFAYKTIVNIDCI
jgi:hypothetical protein